MGGADGVQRRISRTKGRFLGQGGAAASEAAAARRTLRREVGANAGMAGSWKVSGK